MYEYPIEMIQTQMQMQLDGEILKAVQGVGIDVNKEELLKALAYNREQYNKGYKDGVKEFAKLLKEKTKLAARIKDDSRIWVVTEEDIDNILAEMEGVENE